jgi:hypothetical protein
MTSGEVIDLRRWNIQWLRPAVIISGRHHEPQCLEKISVFPDFPKPDHF